MPAKPLAITLYAGIVCLAISLPVSTIAQDKTADDPARTFDTPQVIDQLFKCRSITDPSERLACFDREVGAVYQAQESRELVLAERQDVDEARRGLFGLKLPKIRLFGGGDDDDVNELSTTLAGATKLSNGRHIFELEDGARWIEIDDAAGFRRFEAGDTIVIERGSFGSFKAKVDGKRAVKVRRIN